MSLDRFKTAQADPESGIQTALAELHDGRKTSHWIWYVLPQLARLGRSEKAVFYGLADLAAAQAYAADPVLGPRLQACLTLIDGHLRGDVPPLQLMGSEGDILKLASCVTLFAAAGRGAIRELAASIQTQLAARGTPACAATLAAIASS